MQSQIQRQIQAQIQIRMVIGQPIPCNGRHSNRAGGHHLALCVGWCLSFFEIASGATPSHTDPPPIPLALVAGHSCISIQLRIQMQIKAQSCKWRNSSSKWPAPNSNPTCPESSPDIPAFQWELKVFATKLRLYIATLEWAWNHLVKSFCWR